MTGSLCPRRGNLTSPSALANSPRLGSLRPTSPWALPAAPTGAATDATVDTASPPSGRPPVSPWTSWSQDSCLSQPPSRCSRDPWCPQERMWPCCVSHGAWWTLSPCPRRGRRSPTASGIRVPSSAVPGGILHESCDLSPGGTYGCYGSRSSAPHLLAQPRDPRQLRVSGGAGTIGPAKNKSDPNAASHPQGHTVENLVWMGVDGLVLVALRILLFAQPEKDLRCSQR